jgi:predicted phage tail protein
MARTLDINKIRNYTEGMLEEAFELISSVDRELFPGVIEVYEFMAENCRNYYNEFNPQDHTARALVYATSALQLCEAHGIRVAESTKAKLTNNINDLVQFTQNTWYQARNAGEDVRNSELTLQQQDLIDEAAQLISIGIVASSLLLIEAAVALTAITVMSAAITAAASFLSPPALIITAAAAPYVLLSAVVTLPVIYSVYNDVCEMKAQNQDQNLTPQKLYEIVNQKNHVSQGTDLIANKLTDVISSLYEKIEKNMPPLLKEAMVTKEIVKSVGKSFSDAVSESKVGKEVSKAKNIVQRSARKVNAKFTEAVDSAQRNLSSSDRKR